MRYGQTMRTKVSIGKPVRKKCRVNLIDRSKQLVLNLLANLIMCHNRALSFGLQNILKENRIEYEKMSQSSALIRTSKH